jgi:hypothetical protein
MLQFSVNEQKKVGNHIDNVKEIRQMDVFHLPDQGTAIYRVLGNYLNLTVHFLTEKLTSQFSNLCKKQ